MVKIIQDFIVEKGNVRTYRKRQIKYVVIHETGNTSKGAGAKSHNKYIHNLARANDTSKSWNYTVDDKEIYHHIPDDEVVWACGDGNGPGNTNGISIELCVNSDGDFDKTLRNASELVASLLVKYKLTLKDIRRHRDFANKNCPSTLNGNKVLWEGFLDDIEIEYNRLVGKDKKHWVDGDVEYLASKGITISDKRYDEPITRAECISLIARAVRAIFKYIDKLLKK